jgi:hypothetical protein
MEECPICMENLQFKNRKIHTTACKHSFHAMCLKKVKGGTCPCCRAVLDDVDSKIAKIKDDIKLINADFKEEKRTGNLILSNNRKKTSLLKNNLKEQKKFLKDGVLINTAVWIIGCKEEITKIEQEIKSVFLNSVLIESEYTRMMTSYENLLIERKNSLSELLKNV